MNNSYEVIYSDIAIKKLSKLNQSIMQLIMGFIKKNLHHCENPKNIGKSLSANHKGKWRYRIGDYRILAMIDDENKTILIVDIGHRKNIY